EPEEGEARVDGASLPSTPDQVRQAGVEVLWQDHGLCEELDVVATVFLGREPGRWVIAESDMREGAASVLRRGGAETLPLDPPVRGLSPGQRPAAALVRGARARPRGSGDAATGPAGAGPVAGPAPARGARARADVRAAAPAAG